MMVTVPKICFKFLPDYIVVGSDSGRIVVLEYIPFKNVFERVTTIFDIDS